MKMEIVPCAHPINCDTIFDPHVAEFLQFCVSEGVWHEQDGRNNSGAENLSNSDNDSDTQHDWFSDDDLSSCEGESSLYVINVGTRGSVSIPLCQTESLSGALVACAVRLCERSGDAGDLDGLEDSVRMAASAAAAARKEEADHVEILRVAAKDAKKKYKRLLRVRVDGKVV